MLKEKRKKLQHTCKPILIYTLQSTLLWHRDYLEMTHFAGGSYKGVFTVLYIGISDDRPPKDIAQEIVLKVGWSLLRWTFDHHVPLEQNFALTKPVSSSYD